MRRVSMAVLAVMAVSIASCRENSAPPSPPQPSKKPVDSGSLAASESSLPGAGSTSPSQAPAPLIPSESSSPDIGSSTRSEPVTTTTTTTFTATSSDPAPPSTTSPHPKDPELGINIALAALGGHVESPTTSPVAGWGSANLLDGFPVIRGYSSLGMSPGWRASSRAMPQELIFSFRDHRDTTVSAVVIDTASEGNLRGEGGVPKDVEVLISPTGPSEGYVRVAGATLPIAVGETILHFPASRARYVKLVIRSTHQGKEAQLGEVQIYEAPDVPSILEGLERNLLLPALGGRLTGFTSQASTGLAAQLIDDVITEQGGWSSRASPRGSAAPLPQEFVFAFRDQRPAKLDRVVVNPVSGVKYASGLSMTTWAKKIEVMSSDSGGYDFELVAVSNVPAQAKPVVIPVGRTVRYLKVRILDHNGGDRTTLGEIQAFERGTTAESLLRGRAQKLHRAGGTAAARAEAGARREHEPNDSISQAESFEESGPIWGVLAPLGDRDVFRLPARGGTGKQTVTVALEGQPAIRAAVTMTDPAGATIHQFDPARVTQPRERYSLLTNPGELFLHVSQPPAAQVVIWDTSGSMKGRTADLEQALRLYLGGVRSTDRVHLVRFDDEVEVLLKDFSNDSSMLLTALQNKVYFDGGTSIYDAIEKGVALLEPVAGNRAVVMMTDGEDTTSKTDPSAFWNALEKGRVRLYTIGLGNGLRNYVARAGTTAEQVLANAATTTGGRYWFVADSAQLAEVYKQIAEELRAPATYTIAAQTSPAPGSVAVKTVGEPLSLPLRIELLLDASGSMKRKVGGKSMMTIAQDVLADVVSRLPTDAQVALRVYGHRTPEGRPGDCQDSQLVVPFAALDRERMIAQIKAVKPLGTTPIAYSITAAGNDLRGAAGRAMLILVTDGKEECDGDPVAAAEAVRAEGFGAVLNIVGFGLTSAEDRNTMTSVAAAGGGSFFNAENETSLREAIAHASAVPFSVLDAGGILVARGGVGGPAVAVPEGEFTVRVETAGEPILIHDVSVQARHSSVIELRKDGNQVGTRSSISGNNP